MLEIKLTVANDDLNLLEQYINGEIERLADEACAAQPTTKTGRATVMYVYHMSIRKQIKDFRALLEEKERAARQARRSKRGK
jgi:hypothetical protein